MSQRRSFLPLAVVAFSVLSACGASAPPARELAHEMIDSLDPAEVNDTVKACMHAEVDDFGLTEEQAQGFEDLDDVADKAANGNELAINIITDFQAALASCN